MSFTDILISHCNGGKLLKKSPPRPPPGLKKAFPVTARLFAGRNYFFMRHSPKNVFLCSTCFKVGPGPSGPGPKVGPSPSGPGLKWARAQVGPVPSGPGPKWARAQVGPGPNHPTHNMGSLSSTLNIDLGLLGHTFGLFKYLLGQNSDLKRILDLVASFSQSFSPNRATATPFRPVFPKYSTLFFEYIPRHVKRKLDF